MMALGLMVVISMLSPVAGPQAGDPGISRVGRGGWLPASAGHGFRQGRDPVVFVGICLRSAVGNF